MIYLDNAATTRPFDNVIERMRDFSQNCYFNPSALYGPSFVAAKEVDKVRAYIASRIGSGGKLYFTSCATESNTWAFHSGIKNKKGNIVISMGEHASVYENAKNLMSQGVDVRFVGLNSDGTVNENEFVKAVDSDTSFVSVIHCSNETGTINNLKSLTAHVKKVASKAIFHSDGVQAFGKIGVNCTDLGVDLYSISAHKICGPKGIGALWVRGGLNLSPLLHGGGQEAGLRSGTENTSAIVGFGEALKTFTEISADKISEMRETVKKILSSDIIAINEAHMHSPYILSVSVEGIKAEILQRKLAAQNILIGLGSACSSRFKKNRVLSAMGRCERQIEGSIRISFGPQNLHDDIEWAANTIKEAIFSLKSI